MTTITHPLVKIMTAPCTGQCGGVITLITDGVVEAYAEVEADAGTRYTSGTCEGVSRGQGAITVSCAAMDPADAYRTCDGSVTFTKDALAEEPYATSPDACYMEPMEQAL